VTNIKREKSSLLQRKTSSLVVAIGVVTCIIILTGSNDRSRKGERSVVATCC